MLASQALAPATVRNYSYGKRIFLAWLGDTQDRLSEQMFEDFLVDAMDVGIAYGVINHVRNWLAWCERFQNPSVRVTESSRIREMMQGYQNISTEESFKRTQPLVRKMLEARRVVQDTSPEADPIILGYAFLLRWSELESIYLGSSAVSKAPAGRSYMLYLDRSKTDVRGQGTSTRFSYDLFDRELRDRIDLALSRLVKGQPDSARVNATLRQWFGLRARFHGLRHGRASDLLWQGISKAKLQELGRWRSVKAMTLYAHSLNEFGVPTGV